MVAVAVAVQTADIVAGVCGIGVRASGVALVVDAVRAAVVPVVVADAGVIVPADVATGIAAEIRRSFAVAQTAGRPVRRTVQRDVVAGAIRVNSADEVAHFGRERRIGANDARTQLRHLGAVVVAGALCDVVVTVRNGFAHRSRLLGGPRVALSVDGVLTTTERRIVAVAVVRRNGFGRVVSADIVARTATERGRPVAVAVVVDGRVAAAFDVAVAADVVSAH